LHFQEEFVFDEGLLGEWVSFVFLLFSFFPRCSNSSHFQKNNFGKGFFWEWFGVFFSGAESVPISHHHHQLAICCWWCDCVAHVGYWTPQEALFYQPESGMYTKAFFPADQNNKRTSSTKFFCMYKK
jgi:hypothetical protein